MKIIRATIHRDGDDRPNEYLAATFAALTEQLYAYVAEWWDEEQDAHPEMGPLAGLEPGTAIRTYFDHVLNETLFIWWSEDLPGSEELDELRQRAADYRQLQEHCASVIADYEDGTNTLTETGSAFLDWVRPLIDRALIEATRAQRAGEEE